jgi:hypothetical protein
VNDLTGYLYGAETCPLAVGDTLVYSDYRHLIARFAQQLAPALGSALSTFSLD